MANNTGKKFGGRKKGTPNKMTKELRNILKNILQKEIDLLPNHFTRLKTKERIELLIKLLPYALPKVRPESYRLGEGGILDEWD